MNIILTKKELQKILELNDRANNTPVMVLSTAQGLAGKDFAKLAVEDLREYWIELGKKYDFNPEDTKGIDTKTGKLIL